MAEKHHFVWQAVMIYLICFAVPMIVANVYLAAGLLFMGPGGNGEDGISRLATLVVALHPLMQLMYMVVCVPISVVAWPLGLMFFWDQDKGKVFRTLLLVLCPVAAVCCPLELTAAITVLGIAAFITGACIRIGDFVRNEKYEYGR